MKSRCLSIFFLILLGTGPLLYGQMPPQAGRACFYPSFGQIYQQAYLGSTTVFIYDNGNGPYSFLACSNKTVLQASGSCMVRIPDGQPQGGNTYPGQLFTINQVIPCPLDRNISFLAIVLAAFGVISIRQRFNTV
ncbi:hypothetical protein [Pedobacter sp. R-06]|uniref:hypothetical protein n=1 Tax=Pedobacter sp. R-06 TaxID=3404051 RepID=UPI003CF16451